MNSEQVKKIFKYVSSGAITFLFEYVLFLSLIHLIHFPLGWAQAVSYMAALFVNFALLSRWVFLSNVSKKGMQQVWKYLFLVCFNLPASTALILCLDVLNIPPFVAKAMVIMAIAIWNYFVYDKFIFYRAGSKGDR